MFVLRFLRFVIFGLIGIGLGAGLLGLLDLVFSPAVDFFFWVFPLLAPRLAVLGIAALVIRFAWIRLPGLLEGLRFPIRRRETR